MAKTLTLAQELTEAADATAESWHEMSKDRSYSQDQREAFDLNAFLMEQISDNFHNVEKENQPVIVGEELVF